MTVPGQAVDSHPAPVQAYGVEGGKFRVFIPGELFAKSEGADGRTSLRFGGIFSTDEKDRKGDTVLQDGLDFTDLMDYGLVRLEHPTVPGGGIPIGEPIEVKQFAKGATLPDGQVAPANCTWIEALPYGDAHSAQVWDKAEAMKKAGGRRRMGLSLEGDILARTGYDRKTIAKARVKHCAVTPVPVNSSTGIGALLKALSAWEDEPPADEQPVDEGLDQIVDQAPQAQETFTPPVAFDAPEFLFKSLSNLRPSWPEPLVRSLVGMVLMNARSPAQGEENQMSEAQKPSANSSPAETPQGPAALEIPLEKLTKSMDGLARLLQNPDRQTELTRKSLGGTLSDGEKSELIGLISGKSGTAAVIQEALGGEKLEKSMNGAPFLTELTAGTKASLEALEKSMSAQRERAERWQTAQAEALFGLGTIVKATVQAVEKLSKSLESFAAQPAAQPRGYFAVPPGYQAQQTPQGPVLVQAQPGQTAPNGQVQQQAAEQLPSFSRGEAATLIKSMHADCLKNGREPICGMTENEIADAMGYVDNTGCTVPPKYLHALSVYKRKAG